MYANIRLGGLDLASSVCSLVNSFLPDHTKLDMASKTFKSTNNLAFEAARDRERIELFMIKVASGTTSTRSSFD